MLEKSLGLEIDRVNTRWNVLSALIVFVASLAVYLGTIAPSVAFWDCGEYIGAAHSLGIPHPPGNPLFVLVMRVSSVFFGFFEDVGYRMNFAVAIFSALAAMFICLSIVEAAKIFYGAPDTMQKRITYHVGGIVGGLFAAFGYTFWFSAVETSVYNLSMMNIALCVWLMLVWARSRRPDRDKLLILVAFLGFLGIGLHMYTMIIFPPAFLFMVMWDEKKRKDWRLWATGILMASIIYSLSIFIKVGPAVLLVTLFFALASKRHQYEWRLCFFFALFAILGYSVHLFIPIRSALEPIINEGHPATWNALIEFLERRQYGSESMIERMFWRRGLWSNQFGIDGHMGYGGFHITQFFRFSPTDTEVSFFKNSGFMAGMSKLFIYLIPTMFMIYGCRYLFKKNRSVTVFLAALMLLTSVGMVFYMNFADGNRPESFEYHRWQSAGRPVFTQDGQTMRIADLKQWDAMGRPGPLTPVHREVRVRDYFFTAGFMFFGMWIGLAAVCLLNTLYGFKEKRAQILASICAIALLVSPVLPAASNYALNDRTGDWMPFDYAYNLLNSCEPDGIIFTHGDNDTFPLWALQEAYGIRRDVRVVNLSLVNTDWYIKQLKKLEPQVPITFSEEYIDRSLRPQQNRLAEARPYRLRNANITVMFPGQRELPVIRVQDIMVLDIVDATAWSRPIYFASTVSNDNWMGLAPYVQTQGLVSRLMPEPVGANNYNLERSIFLVDSVYKLRGVGKTKNETSRRMLTQYLHMALDMYQNKMRVPRSSDQYNNNVAAILRFMDRCVELIHWDPQARIVRSAFHLEHDMYDQAVAAMIAESPEDLATFFSHYLRRFNIMDKAIIAIQQAIKKETGDRLQYETLLDQAVATVDMALLSASDPRDRMHFIMIYISSGMTDKAITAIEQAIRVDPEHRAHYERMLEHVNNLSAEEAEEEPNEVLDDQPQNEKTTEQASITTEGAN